MPKDVRHFKQEFRNCMYQLTNDELTDLLIGCLVEAERLRVILANVEYECREPNDEECAIAEKD